MFLKGIKVFVPNSGLSYCKVLGNEWHSKREPSEVSPGFQEIIPWSVPHLWEPPLSLETIRKLPQSLSYTVR